MNKASYKILYILRFYFVKTEEKRKKEEGRARGRKGHRGTERRKEKESLLTL